MAAFASSFLSADPFLSSAAQTGNTQDAYGNILNAAGQQIGVVPGSVADLGSKGTMPTAAMGTIVPAVSSPGTPVDSSPSIWSKIGTLYSRGANYGESFVEDGVFIIVGLLLIAAAIFSFEPARDLAAKAAEAAAA